MKKKHLCFIANNGGGSIPSNGEYAKTRLWLSVLISCNYYDVVFIDLFEWKKKPISKYLKMKKAIKESDIVLLMSAVNGARILIPLINKLIKGKNKRFIYSFIGCGPLSKIISKLSVEQCNRFILKNDFCGRKDKKMGKELAKLDCLLSETDLFTNTINNFYNISNCVTITNFRNFNPIAFSKKQYKTPLKAVFISRVTKIKGIFDLLNSLISINGTGIKYTLDIFGPLMMDRDEEKLFKDIIEKHTDYLFYHGEIPMDKIKDEITQFDLLCFPTKYLAEGTPGILVEALLSNIPILCSSFPQVGSILTEGKDSIIYRFDSSEELKKQLVDIFDNPMILEQIRKNMPESATKFSFDYNKSRLIKYLNG